MSVIKSRYILYKIDYHILWTPKKKILSGKIKKNLVQILWHQAELKKIIINKLEIMPDYVYLYITSPPKYSPSLIVNTLKGITGKKLRELHPEIKNKIKQGVWDRFYYISTDNKFKIEHIYALIRGKKNVKKR